MLLDANNKPKWHTLEWPLKVRRHSPVCGSHSFAVMSAEALASHLPSGENLTDTTPPWCPANRHDRVGRKVVSRWDWVQKMSTYFIDTNESSASDPENAVHCLQPPKLMLLGCRPERAKYLITLLGPDLNRCQQGMLVKCSPSKVRESE